MRTILEIVDIAPVFTASILRGPSCKIKNPTRSHIEVILTLTWRNHRTSFKENNILLKAFRNQEISG